MFQARPKIHGNRTELDFHRNLFLTVQKIDRHRNHKVQAAVSVRYENLTAKDIFDAAKANDTVAVEQVEKMGNILGTALASIACVINPERIVIGGGVSKAGKILIDVIEKHFMEQTFHACRNAEFALAELGNDAGIYGGACLILQNA